MIAKVTGLRVGEFVHTLGDAHLYLNHLDQVEVQLARTPHVLPQLNLKRDVKNLDDFHYEDFEVIGYVSDASIAAPIAV